MTEPTSTGVDARLASVLCYAGWWVTGLVFLFAERRNQNVRFHAAQSLVLFGGLSIVIALLSVFSIGMLVVSSGAFQLARILVYSVWIAAVVIWLLLMYRTFKGETWQVPFAGDLAAKIAAR